MASVSPTKLTLRTLRAEGWKVAVVEHWCSFSKRKKDLFGIIDVLGVHDEHGTIAVQCTTASHLAKRVLKVEESPVLVTMLNAKWRVEVWGWRKKGGRWIAKRIPVEVPVGPCF